MILTSGLCLFDFIIRATNPRYVKKQSLPHGLLDEAALSDEFRFTMMASRDVLTPTVDFLMNSIFKMTSHPFQLNYDRTVRVEVEVEMTRHDGSGGPLYSRFLNRCISSAES